MNNEFNDELINTEYDVNKETSQWAFPGKMRAFVENSDQVIDTQGMTKREYYSLKFACALTAEYVKKPTPAVIEMINTTALKLADDLLKRQHP